MSERATERPTDDDWTEAAPSTHRDHVVAHVVGATVLGHFVHADALHLLLDVGFFWIVYLDAEMGLVAERLAISELDADSAFRELVVVDSDLLRDGVVDEALLSVMTPAPAGCRIEEVELYERGARRKVVVRGEESGLLIETSTDTREIVVGPC